MSDARLILSLMAADAACHDPEFLAALKPHYEIRDDGAWKEWPAPKLLEACRSADVMLIARRSPRFPEELARDRGRLKYICHCHGTIRPYLSKAHLEAGILVTNWGDEVSVVAESAMMLLLACLKQLPNLDAKVQGSPDRRVFQAYPCTLKNLAVGLYGFGPIGRHMARMLVPFEARVAVYDPYAQDIPDTIRRCGSLRELFGSCAVVSIHCGLNDATRHSVNRELLALLPQGGILVNTARGAIVVEEDLAELVREGKVLAGVDVIENERDWTASPLVGLPGAILTGHEGALGKGYPPDQAPAPRPADFVLENLRAFARGEPLKHIIRADEFDLKT